MRRGTSFFAVVAALAVGAGSGAAFGLSYTFEINVPGGNPVENLVFYAAGSGSDDVFVSPVTIHPTGVTTLTHDVGFDATTALIVGNNVYDGKDHIIMFTSDAFAAGAVGYKWSELFPAPSPRHSEMVALLTNVHGGDAGALGTLTTFLRGDLAGAAAFDPDGSYSIIQFTAVEPPIGGDIPEPASLGLLAVGAGAMLFRRRR